MSQVNCVPSYAIIATLLPENGMPGYPPPHLYIATVTSVDNVLLSCLSL